MVISERKRRLHTKQSSFSVKKRTPLAVNQYLKKNNVLYKIDKQRKYA
ncbi:MAG: hypothetical protein AAF335_01050 [Bacteroidota bacterium]